MMINGNSQYNETKAIAQIIEPGTERTTQTIEKELELQFTLDAGSAIDQKDHHSLLTGASDCQQAMQHRPCEDFASSVGWAR